MRLCNLFLVRLLINNELHNSERGDRDVIQNSIPILPTRNS